MNDAKSSIFVEDSSFPWTTVGNGVQRKILGYDEQLMMVRVQFKKGSIGYLHKHPHRQVTFIESGSFEVQIGDRKKILKGSDCYFVPPDIEHGVVALDDSSLVDVFTPAPEDFLGKK